jgi:hypothetical protein
MVIERCVRGLADALALAGQGRRGRAAAQAPRPLRIAVAIRLVRWFHWNWLCTSCMPISAVAPSACAFSFSS